MGKVKDAVSDITIRNRVLGKDKTRLLDLLGYLYRISIVLVIFSTLEYLELIIDGTFIILCNTKVCITSLNCG